MVSLTLKELLENRMEFLEADDISDYVRLVFWKENEGWHEYCFFQKKGAISLGVFKTLLCIRNTDKNAVVMNKFEFMISGTDELIDIDKMVHVVEKEYNEVDNKNNINNFLKRIIRIKDWSGIDVAQFLNFNQEQFLQSELGKLLTDSINCLQNEMRKTMPTQSELIRTHAIIDTIVIALKQFYNVDWM